MNPDDYETLPTDNVATHMTAGAIAGVMEHCIMYPLDSVKTRMQSLTAGAEGISGTFVKMVQQEGMLRPIRGMSAMVMGAGPSHALSFSSYEFLKERGKQYVPPNYHTAVYGASGCVSSLLHDGVMNPAEVVKQRMQMVNSPYRSVLSCIGDIYGKEGLRAFYRSYVTQLTMNVPFQSIHFMVYEFMQKLTNEDRKYNPAAHMVSGAMAGAIAASITTPLDVCKTLLNTQQNPQAQTLTQAIRIIYQLNGPAGYFRGLGARVMFQMPATAICWSTYEFFKYVLRNTPEVRIVPSSSVLAENGQENSSLPPMNESKVETVSSLGDGKSEKPHKLRETTTSGIPRELPAMSGAGLYGSLSYNTMHRGDYRQKQSITDRLHT